VIITRWPVSSKDLVRRICISRRLVLRTRRNQWVRLHFRGRDLVWFRLSLQPYAKGAICLRLVAEYHNVSPCMTFTAFRPVSWPPRTTKKTSSQTDTRKQTKLLLSLWVSFSRAAHVLRVHCMHILPRTLPYKFLLQCPVSWLAFSWGGTALHTQQHLDCLTRVSCKALTTDCCSQQSRNPEHLHGLLCFIFSVELFFCILWELS